MAEIYRIDSCVPASSVLEAAEATDRGCARGLKLDQFWLFRLLQTPFFQKQPTSDSPKQPTSDSPDLTAETQQPAKGKLAKGKGKGKVPPPKGKGKAGMPPKAPVAATSAA